MAQCLQIQPSVRRIFKTSVVEVESVNMHAVSQSNEKMEDNAIHLPLFSNLEVEVQL